MKQKNFAKAYVREIGTEEGTLIGAIGSTAAVDRYGEIIDQDSWDFKNFKKNPVMLWAHNLSFGEDRPPIGKLTKIRVENGQLMFNAKFDMADPFAADIFRKYKEGYLNAFSVGFIPHKIKRYEEDGTQLDHPVLQDNELLEMSAVPVPANPEALNTLRARSFKTKTWDKLMKEVDDDDKDDEDKDDDKPADPPAAPAEPATPDPKPADETDEEKTEAIASRVAVKILPQLTQAITDVVIAAAKPKEDKGGSGSDPKNPQLGGGKPALVRVLRQTTRELQSILSEVNAQRKAAR